MSEAKHDSSDKVPAVLVMADFCRKAAEEGIAEDLEGRVRIGGHPAGVCAKTEMAVDVIFHTSAQAITNVGPVRGSPAVEFMRKAHTGGHVGPQFVFGSEEQEASYDLVRRVRGLVSGTLKTFSAAKAVPPASELVVCVLRHG